MSAPRQFVEGCVRTPTPMERTHCQGRNSLSRLTIPTIKNDTGPSLSLTQTEEPSNKATTTPRTQEADTKQAALGRPRRFGGFLGGRRTDDGLWLWLSRGTLDGNGSIGDCNNGFGCWFGRCFGCWLYRGSLGWWPRLRFSDVLDWDGRQPVL